MSEYIQNIIIIIIQFVRTATQPLPDLNSDSGWDQVLISHLPQTKGQDQTLV